MDAKERARLRALCETIPDGDVTPCCGRAGEDGHHSSWALGMMPHGAALRAWVAGPLDLLALARTALPALLDALDAAERERDEARAGRALAEELACAIGVERDILRRERDEARAEAARLRAAAQDLLDADADVPLGETVSVEAVNRPARKVLARKALVALLARDP